MINSLTMFQITAAIKWIFQHGWRHPEISTKRHYPVLEVFAAVLQQFLELNGAVGYKVVIANRRVVKHRQLDLAAVVHLCHKLIVPDGTVGLLLGRGLTHAKIIYVEGDVRVQQEGSRLGADGVSQRPGCGLQVQSLADLNLQQTVKKHHGHF